MIRSGHLLGPLLLLLPAVAQSCGPQDRNYIGNPNYSYGPANCPAGPSAGTYIGGTTLHSETNAASAIAYCASRCDSYRNSASNDCEAVIIATLSNAFECDFYANRFPTGDPFANCGSGIYYGITGIYPETINSCFASSTAAASQFCMSSYTTQSTVYITTVTPAAETRTTYAFQIVDATDTITATQTTDNTATTSILESDTASQTDTITVYATTTIISVYGATTTVAVATEVATDQSTATSTRGATVYNTNTATTTVSRTTTSVVVTKITRFSTMTSRLTSTKTVTTSVCRVLARRKPPPRPLGIVRRITSTTAIAPMCLSQGGLPTPSSLISSACSCLVSPTVTVPTSTAPQPPASTTTSSITYTDYSELSLTFTTTTTTQSFTAMVTSTVTSDTYTSFTTIYPTVTVQTSTTSTEVVPFTTETTTSATVSVLTTVTVQSTVTKTNIKTLIGTTTQSITSYITNPAITRTTTTKTVTTTAQRSSIPTFALWVRPVNSPSTLYRLRTRFFPANANNPLDRIIQYRKSESNMGADTSFISINATIMNGNLYLMSQNNNPKLYGVSLAIDQGANKGRKVLGQNPDQSTGLQGCTVDKSKGGLLSCKVPGSGGGGGQAPVQWQELAWPESNSQGKFLLAQIPAGGQTKNYQPVMELVARNYGSVQVGCH